MKTARTGTTTATWWSRPGSASTTTTRPPAASPAHAWPTGTRASQGADNIPLHIRGQVRESASGGTGWLLPTGGSLACGAASQVSLHPAFVKCTHGAQEQGHGCPLSITMNWWPLLQKPGPCALCRPSGGECLQLSADSVLALSKSAARPCLGAASSLALQVFPISAP